MAEKKWQIMPINTNPHRDLSFLVFECMISFSLSNENHAFKKQENLLLRFCTALMGMIGQFFQDNKPLNGYIFEYFFIILSKYILELMFDRVYLKDFWMFCLITQGFYTCVYKPRVIGANFGSSAECTFG